MSCKIEGCENTVRALGWCDMHYRRNRTHGDPNVVRIPLRNSADGHYNWTGNNVSYQGMHKRIRALNGSASNYPCSIFECTNLASQWSYDHLDRDEKLGIDRGFLIFYSTRMEHYKPLCASCHRKFDIKEGS